MPDFSALAPLMMNLHREFAQIYYLMLPLFFALAIAIQWFKSPQGGFDFVDVLKRAVIATLLLAAFPDISRAIIFLADGVAERIDSLSSLDAFIKMAEEKSSGISMSPTSVLLAFNDLVIAALTFGSFIVLYFARYLNIAMYHFFWIFFMITSPLLLLFNIFGATSQITANLFKGMIEVACWKIVWAILGAMLASLSFGKIYLIEGSYVTVIVMNFVIAVAMLMTPMVVKSLMGSGLQSMSSTLGPATVAMMIAAPVRAVAGARLLKTESSIVSGIVKNKYQNSRLGNEKGSKLWNRNSQ